MYGELWADLAIVWATICWRAATMPYSPIDSRSPPDHSCVGRNLFLIGGNAAKFRRRCRPWLRDSCLRRNGLLVYGELWADLAIVWATICWRAATMPYSPIDSRSPPDHSCVGRNLFLTGGNAAKFRRRCPWLRDSCLRRNGLLVYGKLCVDFDDCVGDNLLAGGDNAIFADRFPFPAGPFLRRQESLSHGHRRLLNEIPAFAGMSCSFIALKAIAIIDSCCCCVAVGVGVCRQYPSVYHIAGGDICRRCVAVGIGICR